MTFNPTYYVYILTNRSNRVLYTGMTNNLERRIFEHKNNSVAAFTKKYNVNKLVYFESTPEVNDAIAREKEIKKWNREKKIDLINTMNPQWQDLSSQWQDGFFDM